MDTQRSTGHREPPATQAPQRNVSKACALSASLALSAAHHMINLDKSKKKKRKKTLAKTGKPIPARNFISRSGG